MEIRKNYILQAIGSIYTEEGQSIITYGNEYLVIEVEDDGTPVIIPDNSEEPIHIKGIEDYLAVTHAHALGDKQIDSISSFEGFVQEPSRKGRTIGRVNISEIKLH